MKSVTVSSKGLFLFPTSHIIRHLNSNMRDSIQKAIPSTLVMLKNESSEFFSSKGYKKETPFSQGNRLKEGYGEHNISSKILPARMFIIAGSRR